MLFVVLAFFAFVFSSSIDTVAENLSIFLLSILYFCKYLVTVCVMTWKFFSDSNVMVKESNIFFFRSRVQILETEYRYGQYCTPLSQSHCRYLFVLAIKRYIYVLRRVYLCLCTMLYLCLCTMLYAICCVYALCYIRYIYILCTMYYIYVLRRVDLDFDALG